MLRTDGLEVSCTPTAELDDYDAFIRENETATGFHVSGWLGVLSEAFAVQPLFLRARNQSGRLRGVLPLFRSRSVFFGDFISSFEDGHCAADDLTARALAKAAVDLLMQGGSDCLIYKWNFPPQLAEDCRCATVTKSVVPTAQPPEALFDSLSSNTRRKVRKSEKEGFGVRRANDLLQDFHSIYFAHLHRLGTPSFGPQVFGAMQHHLASHLRFYALERDGQLFGGMVCLTSKREWTSLYVAVVAEAQRQYGTYLLYWRVLEDAARNGVGWVNLGRSRPGSGTHSFKQQWAAADIQNNYCILGPRPERAVARLQMANIERTLVQRCWPWLPLSISRRAGSSIRRHLPFL